jgi:hypothetical protein
MRASGSHCRRWRDRRAGARLLGEVGCHILLNKGNGDRTVVTREDFRSLQGDGTASEKREEQSFSVLRSPVAANRNDIGNEIFLSVLWFCFFNFRCQLFCGVAVGLNGTPQGCWYRSDSVPHRETGAHRRCFDSQAVRRACT